MKATFLIGLLTGLLGVFAGAYYAPWGQHLRLPSHTSVQANGGRMERFLVRLPADRIAGHGEGLDRLPLSAGAGTALAVDHYKLRDVDGSVIGVAARHTTSTDEGPVAVWSVVIPSRGGFVLTGESQDTAVLDGLQRSGYRPGDAWTGDLQAGADRESGRLVSGSEEFETLRGTYTESWHLTGVDEAGVPRGTVELTMVTFLGA